MNLLLSLLLLAAKPDDSYDRVMDEINRYSKGAKEKGYILDSYGLHYAGEDKKYDGKIHQIDLGYTLKQRMQYENGEMAFYTLVDGLLNRINSNKELSSYFHHYPVTYEDLYFRLSFDHTKKDDVKMISIFENEIMYFILEKDGEVEKARLDKIVPDVYFYNGDDAKVRTVIKKLPEK